MNSTNHSGGGEEQWPLFDEPRAGGLDPNAFLSAYLEVAVGCSAENAAKALLLKGVREEIAFAAAEHQEYWALIEEEHGSQEAPGNGQERFRTFILDKSKHLDILALCLLVECYNRRLNLYVPWTWDDGKLHPLRIEPGQLKRAEQALSVSKADTRADAGKSQPLALNPWPLKP